MLSSLHLQAEMKNQSALYWSSSWSTYSLYFSLVLLLISLYIICWHYCCVSSLQFELFLTFIVMVALWNRADHYIFILFLLLLLSFFPRLISAVGDWLLGCLPYFGTWCGLSVNLECRSEMRCRWLAANTGRKKSPSRHHRTTLSGHIFATKACINKLKKNLLSSNTSSTCPDNMVNFSLRSVPEF